MADDDVRVNAGVVIPGRELTWRFSHASGPGGQHVNTTNSHVELSWDVASSVVLTQTQRERALDRLHALLVDGVLTVSASTRRSQLRNRDEARRRLADLVAAAVAPPAPPRRATRPGKAARQRRLDAKARRSDVKRLRRPPTD